MNKARLSRLFGICALVIVLLALLLRLNVFFGRIFPLGGDDANYVKLAWSMRYASSPDMISGLMFSFGYSIIIFLASFIINNLDIAAIAVSFTFGVGSVLLVVLLGRLLFGRPAALIAGFGLALFVPHILVSTSAYSESTFIFFTLLSVYVFARGVVETKPRYYYFLCGLIFGYAFIIRSEIEVVLGAAMLVGLYMLRVRHRLPAKRLLLIASLVVAAFLAVNIPKIIWLHDVTGSWMLDNKENYVMRFIGSYQDDLRDNASYEVKKNHFEESVYGFGPDGKLNLTSKYNFGKWFLANPSERLSFYKDNVKISLKNITISVAVLMVLAILPFILGGKEGRYGRWLTACLFTPVVFIPFFYSIGGHSWYGQWEPSVEFAPPLMLLAADGLWLVLDKARGALANKGKEAAFAVLAVALVLWGTPATLREIKSVKGMMEQGSPEASTVKYSGGTIYRLLDQMTGRLIDRKLPKGAKIMVRSWTISRYSNRERVMLPYGSYPAVIDYARKNGVDYIVVGGSECIRPDLDFLVAPRQNIRSPYRDAAAKDLELVMSFETMDLEGKRYNYYLSIYRLKK